MTPDIVWLPGQWFTWRHAVRPDAPPVTLMDGRTIHFGLCGLATLSRRSRWLRCPIYVRRLHDE